MTMKIKTDKNLYTWHYGVVYDKPEDEFIIAEIYLTDVVNSDEVYAWCPADVAARNTIELALILQRLFEQCSKSYYIWDGEELHENKI